jgi:hypothetical protein
MKRILIGVAAVMIVTLMSGPVLAGTQNNAVLSLHLKTHAKAGICDTVDPVTQGIACSNYVLSGNLTTAYDMYLTMAKGEYPPGLAALSCGIIYDNGVIGGATQGNATGLDVFSWTLCTSGLQFPNGPTGLPQDEWPASGGGNRITWNAVTDCKQTGPGSDGVQAVAGVFYVYAYTTDFFQITENLNLLSGPELQVGDCNNSITNIPVTSAAFAKFSAGAVNQGCNPCVTGECIPVATKPTTWGKIKQKY